MDTHAKANNFVAIMIIHFLLGTSLGSSSLGTCVPRLVETNGRYLGLGYQARADKVEKDMALNCHFFSNKKQNPSVIYVWMKTFKKKQI